MTSSYRSMKLIGYEPLTGENTGFCTGLYTAVGKSNEVFVPISLVEGGGTSTVADFVSVTPRDAFWFNNDDEDWPLLSIGDPWKDVLLLEGQILYGTRQHLLAEAAWAFDALLRDYPFTAVDLVRDFGGKDRPRAVKAAYDRISKNFTHSEAESWALGTYFRGQIQTHLRRKLVQRNASVMALEALRYIRVAKSESDTIVEVSLPGSQEFNPEDIAPILRLGDDREAINLLAELSQILGRLALRGRIEDGTLVAQYRPKPIAVIAIGRLSEQVGRTLMEDAGRPHFILDTNWPSRLFVRTTIADLEASEPDSFSLAVVILDDDLTGRDQFEFEQVSALIDRLGLPMLITPTLPKHAPSALLSLSNERGIFGKRIRALCLDTSAVRSPFYLADRSTSLTRRTALQLVQACLLLLSGPNSLQRFYRELDRKGRSCLTVTYLGNGADRHTVPSEAVEASDEPKLTVRGSIRSAVSPSTKRQPTPTGIYEIWASHLREEGIDDLAMGVVSRALSELKMKEVQWFIGDSDFPAALESMEFPHLKTLVDLEIGLRLLVTAESPSLKTLLRMAEAGVQAVRYSDIGTIKRCILAAVRGRPEVAIPSDMLPLGVPQRFSWQQSTVFLRAVQSPGLVIDRSAWNDWAEKFPDHPLAARAKTIMPTGVKGDREIRPAVALSTIDVHTALLEGGEAFELLRERRETRPEHMGINRLMFMDDPVTSGVFRWVFRAGRFPIGLRRLPKEITVGEGWIVFDGDQYAAAMVASRMFETWTKAHTSDFSPSNTRKTDWAMNAFPWPAGFKQIDGNAMICTDPTPRFQEVCSSLRFIDLTLDYRDLSPGERMNEAEAQYGSELNLAALSMYDFPAQSSDLHLLGRLVALNHENEMPTRMPRLREFP
ncbi:hypothetical protein LVY75_05155 (plasmid) [Sinorhizobium sp. B11]